MTSLPVENPAWLALVLRERDGAFAFDALREVAQCPASPDMASAEQELVARADALCDLAVAAYGRDQSSVRAVYQRTQSDAIRAAVLGNPYCEGTGWGGSVLPECDVAALLDAGDPACVSTLFANPRLSPDGLLCVLEQHGPATSLGSNSPVWASVLAGLARNPSLRELFDSTWSLPSANARLRNIEALKAVLTHLAVTDANATAASGLLEALLDARNTGYGYEDAGIDKAILHWHSSVASDAVGHPYFAVQLLLGVLYNHHQASPHVGVFLSERAATVALTDFPDKQSLLAIAESDPVAFYAGMPFHIGLYTEPELADAFVGLAAVDHQDSLARYLTRQSRIDATQDLDGPVSRRDFAALRHDVRRLTESVPPPSKSSTSTLDVQALLMDAIDKHLERSQSVEQDNSWPKNRAFWKIIGMSVLLTFALLMIFALIQHEAGFPIFPGLPP